MSTPRSSTFRSTGHALVTSGMLAIAALGLTTRSFAGETTGTASLEGVTLSTDCSKYRPNEIMSDTKCLILKRKLLETQGRALDAQGRALDAQGRDMDAQAAGINKVGNCIAELFAFKKASPDKFAELGKVTRENACALAEQIKTRASINAPRAGG